MSLSVDPAGILDVNMLQPVLSMTNRWFVGLVGFPCNLNLLCVTNLNKVVSSHRTQAGFSCFTVSSAGCCEFICQCTLYILRMIHYLYCNYSSSGFRGKMSGNSLLAGCAMT